MKEKTWPANLLKELDKFAWKEESVTVSVRFEKEPEE
jgi:hypothetical protein